MKGKEDDIRKNKKHQRKERAMLRAKNKEFDCSEWRARCWLDYREILYYWPMNREAWCLQETRTQSIVCVGLAGAHNVIEITT